VAGNQKITSSRPRGAQRAHQVGLFSGGLHSPHHGCVIGKLEFFMAAVGAALQPHPRPGIEPPLLVRVRVNPAYFAAIISRVHSTCTTEWERV